MLPRKQKRGGMMSTILFIENDAALVSTINDLIRLHLHTVGLLLHTDNEEQALSLCQEYTPQLIIFDSDILDDEHLYPLIDKLKELLPDSILILLLNENDIVRLRTFLRQRNERFLLKPLDEHNFLDIISACLKEITTIADDRDLISRLTERMQRFRPQLENMLIHDIAVNAPAERILQNLSILGYTFCEGVIAAVPVTEPKTVKDQVSALFARWGYDVIRSDFFEYSLYLILAHPFFRYEDVKRLEKQIALLNSDTFFLGTGYVKRSIKQLHLCYKEAVEEILINRVIPLEERLSEHDRTQLDIQIQQRARIIFAYFLMMNESHVKVHLRTAAQMIFLYSPDMVRALIEQLAETLSTLLARSFHEKHHTEVNVRQKFEDAKEVYHVLQDLYQRMSEPYQQQRNDAPHAQLRKILYHILNNHTASKLCLNDVADDLDISEYYICKLFRNYTDFTFTEFLNICRVEHAKNLLKSEYKIKEIAHEVGFQSSTYFGRVFRALTTLTPREYRSRFIYR